MNRPAMLRGTICTPWGYYAPGLEVSAVRIEGPTVTICLDNNHHPAGVCHFVRVPHSQVTIAHDRQHQAA